MALPAGPEYGAKYTLTGPDGTVAVFNDSASPNFVGILSPESSGLDSADVRESAVDAVEEDGGVHGNFYYGRRPVVLQGTIIATSAEDRNKKAAKLQAASNAMRGDATLKWTPGGGEELELKLRRQQPVRITKGFVKEFQIPMVSAYAYICSAATVSKAAELKAAKTGPASVEVELTNNGTAPSPLIVTVSPANTWNEKLEFENVTTKNKLVVTGAISAEDLIINFKNHTLFMKGGTNAYKYLSFTASEWWNLISGVNKIKISTPIQAESVPTKLTLAWQHNYV